MKADAKKVSAVDTKQYPFTGEFEALDVICGNERSDGLRSHIQRLWKGMRIRSMLLWRTTGLTLNKMIGHPKIKKVIIHICSQTVGLFGTHTKSVFT